MIKVQSYYFNNQFINLINSLLSLWLSKSSISRMSKMTYRNLCILLNKNKTTTIKLKSESVSSLSKELKKLWINNKIELSEPLKNDTTIKKLDINIKWQSIELKTKQQYIELLKEYGNCEITIFHKGQKSNINLSKLHILFNKKDNNAK